MSSVDHALWENNQNGQNEDEKVAVLATTQGLGRGVRNRGVWEGGGSGWWIEDLGGNRLRVVAIKRTRKKKSGRTVLPLPSSLDDEPPSQTQTPLVNSQKEPSSQSQCERWLVQVRPGGPSDDDEVEGVKVVSSMAFPPTQ
jgi:hypothetical protein